MQSRSRAREGATTAPLPPPHLPPAGRDGADPLPAARGAGALRLQTFSSLRYRNYRYLFFSQLFSSAGQWIQQVTLSWLVYDLTESALLLGAINGVRAVPFLIAGPLGGVAADRVDRRYLMMSTQVFLAVTALVLGLLVATDRVEVWHLFAFTLCTGIAWSFNQPVRQALVPSLVPKQDLMNAIALNSAAFNITRVIGPTVGGLLIGAFGVAGNFFVQAVAYLGVVAMVFFMELPPRSETQPRRSSVGRDLMAGLRYVREDTLILSIIGLALIPMIFAMPYVTLMPVFAKDVLGLGPGGLGLLISAPGFGALAATLTLASLSGFRRKGILTLTAAACLGGFLILFATSSWLPVSMLVLVGVGACQMAFMATNNTLLQLLVPDEYRGRVMSIYMLDMGLTPLGALFAGALASGMGAPTAVAVMGALVVALALVAMVRLPALRRLE
ncbi:MAG: MFS transporter [Chloroflexi bacterium]|nr:MFS transporter [Chloroflexota bacterium]